MLSELAVYEPYSFMAVTNYVKDFLPPPPASRKKWLPPVSFQQIIDASVAATAKKQGSVPPKATTNTKSLDDLD